MRIINQKAAPTIVDFPYDEIIVQQDAQHPNEIIAVHPIGTDDDIYTIAIYSTVDKARKAINQLHSAYTDIIQHKIFQFPEDNEI